ncbi:hypothetical protein DM02DRAFT_698064 [Periconia macrospinosa]|uniref:Uncharacterized protein n=1 Tax=Periconia macrospinosa TaxID=97972 RepID=A0A2V1D4D2_9PLEO|nr:hypothetical protein DM02DRAFT_698064 [Periconia macrospinosa]
MTTEIQESLDKLMNNTESLMVTLDHAKMHFEAQGKVQELKGIAKKIQSIRLKHRILLPGRSKYRNEYTNKKSEFEEVHQEWKEGFEKRAARLAEIHRRQPCGDDACSVKKFEAKILEVSQSILPLPGDEEPEDV